METTQVHKAEQGSCILTLDWGSPVSCRSREEVPRGQPHSPCTENAMLSNLPSALSQVFNYMYQEQHMP